MPPVKSTHDKPRPLTQAELDVIAPLSQAEKNDIHDHITIDRQAEHDTLRKAIDQVKRNSGGRKDLDLDALDSYESMWLRSEQEKQTKKDEMIRNSASEESINNALNGIGERHIKKWEPLAKRFYGDGGNQAFAALQGANQPTGFVEGITKTVYDKNDGGMQWGGVIGAIGGLLLGMMGGDMMGGGWWSVVAAIGGALLGAWLGEKSGDTVSGMFTKSPEPAQGMGKSRYVATAAAPDASLAPATEITVEEGKTVQLIKTNDGKKIYLAGQDENGNLIYDEAPPAGYINFSVMKDGKQTGFLAGKFVGEDFFASQKAALLPGSERMGPTIDISPPILASNPSNELDFNSPALAEVSKKVQEANTGYLVPMSFPLKTDPVSGKLSAELGSIKGDDGLDYKVVITTSTSTPGGDKAVFSYMLLKDKNGDYVKGANGAPLEVHLPDEVLQNNQVINNNTVSFKSVDVETALKEFAPQILDERKRQFAEKGLMAVGGEHVDVTHSAQLPSPRTPAATAPGKALT
jgi:hypothetical protein